MTGGTTLQNWTYLGVLAACIVGTLPLEFVLRARVYRRWQLAVLAILPVSVVFLTWDYLAAHAGWWWFNQDYITGVWIGGLPLEELLFFLVIPVCGLLTIEGVRHVRPDWGRAADAADRSRRGARTAGAETTGGTGTTAGTETVGTGTVGPAGGPPA